MSEKNRPTEQEGWKGLIEEIGRFTEEMSI